MKKLIDSRRISSFVARVIFLPRWLILTLGFAFLFYLTGLTASPDLPLEPQVDTRSRLLANYSPWANTLFRPLSNLIFEAISAETGRNADPDAITDIKDRDSFWQDALPAGVEPEITSTSTPTDIPTTATPIPPSPTATITATPQPTLAISLTASLTYTPTNTPTFTPTNTNTPEPTPTPSNTPSHTPSFTPTFTPSNTPTNTPTFTPTFTPSPTPACVAGTINRAAFQDARVEENRPDRNYGGARHTHVEYPSLQEHSLIEFDISDIDPSCNVSSGVLKIEMLDTDPMIVEIYRITQSWNEGTLTWNTEPSNDAVRWASFSTNVASPVTLEIDITSLIQSWVDLSNDNHGLIMVGISGTGHVKFTALDDNTTDPRLTIVIGP